MATTGGDAVSPFRGIMGRGLLYTLSSAAPAITSVAVLPLVTRILDVEQYAVVALGTVIVQVGMILCALGMGAAITRQYILDVRGPEGARGLVLQSVGFSALLAAAAAATGGLWSGPVLGRDFTLALVLAVLTCAGATWCLVAQSYFRGADRPLAFVLVAVGAYLGGPAVGLLLVLAEPSATRFLAGVLAVYTATGVAAVLAVHLSGPRSATTAGLREAMRIGLPTLPHQVSLYLVIAGLVVIADRTLADGGRANIMLTLGAGATIVIAALNNAWAPAVYRTPTRDRGRVLTATVSQIGWVAVLLAGIVAVTSPALVSLLAPPSYRPEELVGPVSLATIGALLSVVYLASGHLVFASGRTALLSLSTPLAVAIGLAAALLAAPGLGMTAIALGYVATYAALMIGTTAVELAVAPERWRPPLLPGHVAVSLAVAALGAYLPTSGLAAVLLRGGVTAALLAGGLVLLARLMRPRDVGLRG